MKSELIFLPALLQIALTIYVFIALSIAKTKAAKNGQVNEERRGLYDDAWPESVLKINNNIRNQFEVPVLFYVLVIMLWALNSANLLAQIVAWLFVSSRVMHTYIHTGSNFVPARRRVFMFGCIMVLLLTIVVLVAVIK